MVAAAPANQEASEMPAGVNNIILDMSQNDGAGTERQDANENSQVQLLANGANVPVQVITPSEVKQNNNGFVVPGIGPKRIFGEAQDNGENFDHMLEEDDDSAI